MSTKQQNSVKNFAGRLSENDRSTHRAAFLHLYQCLVVSYNTAVLSTPSCLNNSVRCNVGPGSQLLAGGWTYLRGFVFHGHSVCRQRLQSCIEECKAPGEFELATGAPKRIKT
jgi:hypothetical protein